MMRSLCLTLLALAGSLAAQPTARILDLGHPLSDTDPTWSGNKAFSRSGTAGEGFAMGQFSSDEHFGTHLDAPVHAGGRLPPTRSRWTVCCGRRSASTCKRPRPGTRTTG